MMSGRYRSGEPEGAATRGRLWRSKAGRRGPSTGRQDDGCGAQRERQAGGTGAVGEGKEDEEDVLAMPRPLNERQSLEQERAELLGRITADWQELENGALRRVRREWLECQIRNLEKRLADVRVRLRAIRVEGG
jgi:hypothetical protein